MWSHNRDPGGPMGIGMYDFTKSTGTSWVDILFSREVYTPKVQDVCAIKVRHKPTYLGSYSPGRVKFGNKFSVDINKNE